nr:uncharacterized protein LOC112036926 [Quercus suber]
MAEMDATQDFGAKSSEDKKSTHAAVPMAFPLQDQELNRENIRRCVSTAPALHEMGSVRVARVQKGVVVKYGSSVALQEARNMQFVNQSTDSVNLPTLLDAWSVSDSIANPDGEPEDETVSYIVMTFISGNHLEHAWLDMTEQEQAGLLDRICNMLRALQRLKVATPGPIGGGKSRGHFFTQYDAGPFTLKADLQYWLNNRLRICKRFERVPQDRPPFELAEGLVMCHMDLHPMNIIVDAQGAPWFLDWGRSGAYPPYFEAANLLRTRGGSILQQLYDCFHDSKDEESIRRLTEMEYAFSTGAMFYRGDIGFGDEY